jgi:hypothetical protein
MCLDGVRNIHLLDWFRRGEVHPAARFAGLIDLLFPDGILDNTDGQEYRDALASLSTLRWTEEFIQKWKDDSRQDGIIGELPTPLLQCCNSKTGKFIGLTDALWRSTMLGAAAMDPKISLLKSAVPIGDRRKR